MTIIRISTLICISALLASCATQPTVQSQEATETSAPQGTNVVAANTNSEPDPNEMICRREQVTGSNFRRRVCMTRAERDQRMEESRDEALLRRSSQRNTLPATQ